MGTKLTVCSLYIYSYLFVFNVLYGGVCHSYLLVFNVPYGTKFSRSKIFTIWSC